MTVENKLPIQHFTANGITKDFAINFEVEGKDNIRVTANNEVVSKDAYSYDSLTKSVVFNIVPVARTEITIERVTCLDRSINYQTYNNSFRPETLNYDLDRIWHVLQEQNIVDAEIIGRIKDEIEWRRTHDFNYDELAKIRDLQIFESLKQYLDTILATTTPNIFGGVTAGIVFAEDKKSIQTHIELIATQFIDVRNSINLKANQTELNQIKQTKANQTDLDALGVKKADKAYVDSAVIAIASGNYYKSYPSLVLANADIANIPLNASVKVLDGSEGGDYYKASADSTQLTKAKYDPLNLAKEFFYTETGYYKAKNIVNPNQELVQGFFDGTGVSGTGSEAFKNYYVGQDFYAVVPKQKLWLKGVIGGQVLQYCRADKTVIWAGSSSEIVNGILTIPDKVANLGVPAYLRIGTSLGISAFKDGIVAIGYGDTVPTETPLFDKETTQFKDSAFKDTIVKLFEVPDLSAYINNYENVVNPGQELIQGFFDGSTIIKNPTSFPNYFIGSDFYAVKPNQKIWTTGTGGASVQYYREDKSPIWSASIEKDSVITVPNNVSGLGVPAFIRLATNGGEKAFKEGQVGLGYSSIQPTQVPKYQEKYAEPTDILSKGILNKSKIQMSPLYNKSIVVMGDSITNAWGIGSYANILADKYQAKLTKHAQDGARIHRENDESPYLVLSEEYLKITANPDLIIVAGGTNDPSSPEQLGVFSDRTKYTLYGALHILCAGLREKFTDARIGFLAPIPSVGSTFIDGDLTTSFHKYKAIRDVCNYYGIPVWNGQTEFGAHPRDLAWKNKYMPDGLHPNRIGHEWYANRVEQFVLNLAK